MNLDTKQQNLLTQSVMQAMMENMTDIMFVKNTDLIYLCVSRSFGRLVGTQNLDDIVGKTDAQIFDDEELIRRYIEDDKKLLASQKPLKAYVEPLWLEDGSRGYCRTSKFPVFDDGGNIIGLYGIARDITREYKAKQNYERELSSLFELPANALGAALFDVTNWRIVDVRINDEKAWKALRFSTVDDFIKNSMDMVVNDDKIFQFYRSLSQESIQSMFECGKRRINLEFCRRLPGDSIRWVRNELYFMFDPLNDNLCVMSIVLDIDEEKQAAKALARAAQRDALTDIYNRETIMSQIHQFLEGEGAGGNHLLFMIDVDNFKLLNDTFGHQTGDEALVYIAGAIRNIFKAPDIVGRIGGDEFFALMKNVDKSKAVWERAQELVTALQYECSEGSDIIELSGSVGISCYSGGGKTLEQLYSEADSALYEAKKLGKNRFVFADMMLDCTKVKGPLNTVNLRTLLCYMDAGMFQTELDDRGEIRVTYSSHNLFSDPQPYIRHSGAREEDIWNIVLPEDLEELKRSVRRATFNNEDMDCTCRVKNTSGQIEWRHVCGTQLPDQGDGIIRMIHVVTDITRQKKIEAELREKNSIIDLAMLNSGMNLWYFNYKTKECQLTVSYQKAHNKSGKEVLENFPECLIEQGEIRGDCVELLRSQYRQLCETGEPVEFDVWFCKENGEDWYCERETLFPLADAYGCAVRGIGIGRDVTAEKLLEKKHEAFGVYQKLAEKNTRLSLRMNLTTGWFGDCITSTEAVKALYPADTEDEFLKLFSARIVLEEERNKFLGLIKREHLLSEFLNGNSFFSIDCRFRNENEGIIWLRITTEIMSNPVTGDVEALFYTSDIDHEKNMQLLVNKLMDDDYEFLGLMDVSSSKLMVFGENIGKADWAYGDLLYDDIVEMVFSQLIPEEYFEEGVRNVSSAHVINELSQDSSYTCSFPARDFTHHRLGRKQWKFAYLDESKSKILIARTDVTGAYTVEYDTLTGLYNRETFYRRVREMLDANPSQKFIMLRFDIDRFKAYNDVYGAQAGDRILAAAGKAARIKKWPELSVFGRLEADHFVSIMPVDQFDVQAWSVGHIAWLETVTEGYRLTSSVGVYEITDPSLEVSLMCDRALLALRTVKDSYTQKVAWYDESLREKLMLEQALADDMEQALKENQFVLFFQPLVNYNDDTLIGAEALVRWRHPVRGLISPGEFIPIFEKNGFILKLDAFVWEESCKYLRGWIDAGKRMVPVSVNVSRCDLYDPGLCEKFVALLTKYNLPFSMLKLEITESAYMEEPAQLIEVVERLRSIGFTVEMDDFGTGYSSLNMLKDMPVDILKLDTRFISESEGNARGMTILSAVVRMAHKLGLTIVAEGVETREQADSLKELNCHNMQGYYFSRPVPVNEFEEILNKLTEEKNWKVK